MNIGPLEYVVIGVTDSKDHHQLMQALLPELNTIQEKDQIRVVDLVSVKKAANGDVVMQELNELDDPEKPSFGNIAENITGLLTKEDVDLLTGQIPLGTSALVILLEHSWVTGLTEAVRKGGGLVFAGGMIPHDQVTQIVSELTNKEA